MTSEFFRFSTSAKYSAPGSKGTRLMLVNEVALGKVKVWINIVMYDYYSNKLETVVIFPDDILTCFCWFSIFLNQSKSKIQFLVT